MSTWHLECSVCDYTQAGNTLASVCPTCGQPLLVHYDSAFTQKTYVHASDDDLQRGQAALAKIHKIA